MAGENSDKRGSGGPLGFLGSSGIFVTILSVMNFLVNVGLLGIIYIKFKEDKDKPSVEDIVSRAMHAEQPDSEKSEGKKGEEGKKSEGEGAQKSGETAGNHSDSSSKTNAKMVALDQFTINLATIGSSNPKYVRVNISLEVPPGDLESEVSAKGPQIRNTIIDLFNSKRPADLATVEGREYIKEEIKSSINNFLVSGKVKGVFFTNFALSG